MEFLTEPVFWIFGVGGSFLMGVVSTLIYTIFSRRD